MSILFSDDFAGTGAVDSAKWVYPGWGTLWGSLGGLTRSSGFLTTAPSSGGDMWSLPVMPTADYTVTMPISSPAVLTAQRVLLWVRATVQDYGSGYAGYFLDLDMDSASDVGWLLRKCGFTGSWSAPLASGSLGGLSGTVALSAIGSTITAYVNGVPVASIEDSVVPGPGRIALTMYNDTGVFSADSITVTGDAPTAFWTNFVRSTEVYS